MLTKNKYNLLLSAFAILVLVYVVLRAFCIPITHDEAYSFHNMKRFWYAESLCTGNTHWLNSLAIKTAILLKLESVFAIRWFSLLSAAVFFCLTLLWMQSKRNFVSALFILSLCLLNPYVLDYFSIARGYASGLMFESLSLFFFLRTTEGKERGPSFLSLLFSGLSAIANYSFFYFFAAFSIVYFIRNYFAYWKSCLKTKEFYRDSGFVFIICLLVLRSLLFITRCSNDVLGAGTDHVSEFCRAFTQGLFQINSGNESALMIFGKWGAFVLVLLSSVRCFMPGKKASAPLYYYAAFMLLLELVLIFAGHYFFQFVLPATRSALFLFPLTVVCFVCFLESIIAHYHTKKIILLTLSVLLILNFLLHLNVTSVSDYHLQADLKKGMDFLESEGATKVGMSGELYGGFRNYYEMTEKRKYSFAGEELRSRASVAGAPVNTDLAHYDFLILVPPYDLGYYHVGGGLRAVTYFPETGTLILKVN